MPRSRHRVEPARRSFPRLTRPVAASAGTALLSLTLVASLSPGTGPGTGAEAVATADTVRSAEAMRAAAVLRAEQRSSRSRTARPATTPAVPAPTAAGRTPQPVPAVVGRLWVKEHVNIRSGPSSSTGRIGSLTALTRASVTGVTANGWTQVVAGGRAGWVRSTYLSSSKPAPQPARVPSGVSGKSCSISSSIEPHLTANAASVYRAVCAAFGDSVSSFGGYRAGDDGDHGSGRAVDIMVSGEPGGDIARYVQAHARELGVTYVIYQQRIWLAGDSVSDWESMADRGSRTANHYDHVHVSVA